MMNLLLVPRFGQILVTSRQRFERVLFRVPMRIILSSALRLIFTVN